MKNDAEMTINKARELMDWAKDKIDDSLDLAKKEGGATRVLGLGDSTERDIALMTMAFIKAVGRDNGLIFLSTLAINNGEALPPEEQIAKFLYGILLDKKNVLFYSTMMNEVTKKVLK